MIQIDIPMPKMCYDCPCHDGESCRCQITGKYCFDEIPRSCPLKEVRSTGEDLIPWEDFIESKSCQLNDYGFCSDGERNADSNASNALEVLERSSE